MKPLWILLSLLLLASPLLAQEDGIRADLNEHESHVQIQDPKDLTRSAPEFSVRPRIPVLTENGFYPCADNCHAYQEPNPKVRELAMHGEIPLNHGKGQFWCTQCHDLKNRNQLTSLKGKKINYNEAYLLCGQCHQARLDDFLHGGHGKNQAGWKGKKLLTNCTECHNPHIPQIRAKAPQAGPAMRKGLEYDHNNKEKHQKFWPSDFKNHQTKDSK